MAVPSALVPIWYEARTSSPHPHSLQRVLRVGGNFIILTRYRPGMLAGWLAGFAPRQSPYASEQATFLNLHGHDETDSVVVDCPRVAACCLSLLSPHPE